MRLQKLTLSLAAFGLLAACSTAPTGGVDSKPADSGIFFDDFNYANMADFAGGGWLVRDKFGLPGIATAHWGAGAVSLVDDPDHAGNRMVRLTASTDGTIDGTLQGQICHQRKYLEGTYATRLYLSDVPMRGPDGDTLVQSFYVVSPLKHAYDPKFSEIDWEYLPNGGWGDATTRLYSTSWQTVSLDPWDAHNHNHEVKRPLGGWHILLMQVSDGKSRFFLDGVQVDESGGRNYPVVPMSINFNNWFIAGGFVPGTKEQRAYNEDIDWVFHAKNRVLSPAEVDAFVANARKGGSKQVDSVPAMNPALASTCDF